MRHCPSASLTTSISSSFTKYRCPHGFQTSMPIYAPVLGRRWSRESGGHVRVARAHGNSRPIQSDPNARPPRQARGVIIKAGCACFSCALTYCTTVGSTRGSCPGGAGFFSQVCTGYTMDAAFELSILTSTRAPIRLHTSDR